jgi:ribose/xylose/arabinose/galactoside ABC-type transport system permease subunit
MNPRINQTMTTPTVIDVAPEVKPLGWRAKLARQPEWFTFGLIIVMCLIVGAINPRFFQLATLFDMLHSATTVSLFALGTLVVLASGGIDVSFTAIGALTMYAITKAVFAWWPDEPFALILITGALGGIVLGLINGVLVYRLKAPSLIVTIGTQYLYEHPAQHGSLRPHPAVFLSDFRWLARCVAGLGTGAGGGCGSDMVAAEPDDDGARRVRHGRQPGDCRAPRL